MIAPSDDPTIRHGTCETGSVGCGGRCRLQQRLRGEANSKSAGVGKASREDVKLMEVRVNGGVHFRSCR